VGFVTPPCVITLFCEGASRRSLLSPRATETANVEGTRARDTFTQAANEPGAHCCWPHEGARSCSGSCSVRLSDGPLGCASSDVCAALSCTLMADSG
jgi:hypothetical protein